MVEMELSEPARLLLLASLLAKDGLISHNGESAKVYPAALVYLTPAARVGG